MVGMATPVFQLYEFAPLAVKVAVPPAQIVVEFTLTIGNGFTVMVDVAEFLQAFIFVPVTV